MEILNIQAKTLKPEEFWRNFMKRKTFLLIISNLFLFSCSSLLPTGEGSDELHGSSWVFRNGALTEYFDFHDGGRYLWRSNWRTSTGNFFTDEDRGTYLIEGKKLILFTQGTFSVRIVATFSDNRQSFSYVDRVFELSTVRRTYSYPARTLMVKNIPSGDFNVGIYSGNSVPRNRTEYRNMTNDTYIGGGSGNSPFEIFIIASAQTAPRLISIIDKDVTNARFSVVEFTDNDTTVIDWNDMIDLYSLSR